VTAVVDSQVDTPVARQEWPALPRRQAPRRRARLWAVRAPIPRPAYITLAALSILAPLAAWLLLSASGQVNPRFLPSVLDVWSAGVEMARSGQLLTDAWASVRRVLIGFGLAAAVSAPLGLLLGSFRAGQALLEPMMGLLRYLPAAAFIPLLMIYLGLEEAPKVALLFIGTVFFNTLMTADVVRQVPPSLIDVSYTLGARRGEVLRKVILPHSLPGMIDTLRVNAAAAWNLVVVAELIAAEEGLGYRIARSARFTQTDKIFAVLVVIALIGLATDVLLRSLRDRVGRWAP
jgi:NitT/TauT family transport system permease protein